MVVYLAALVILLTYAGVSLAAWHSLLSVGSHHVV